MGKQLRNQKAYCPLLLFKILFVGQWHKLPDLDLDSYAQETLSARHNCGLATEDSVPNHDKISRFRTRLLALGAGDG